MTNTAPKCPQTPTLANPWFVLRWVAVAMAGLVALALLTGVQAGARFPGKYSGVVVFDRWDTCMLISGGYVTYVSEKVKEELRPHNGRAIQVYASDVWQPMNPGDALIRKYKILGDAPRSPQSVELDSLTVRVESDFAKTNKPEFLVEFSNLGKEPFSVLFSRAGLTVLSQGPRDLSPSDGKSVAVLTRYNFSQQTRAIRAESGNEEQSASFTIYAETARGESIFLEPGKSARFRLSLKLPPGQYQLLVGYGGDVHEYRSILGNSIWFDINDKGEALLVPHRGNP